VAAYSEGLGQGSEFEISIPTLEGVVATVPERRPSISTRRRHARGARTVLIVEDNRDAREMLATLCHEWGYRVEVADEGLEAVERALAAKPEVALIDIGLPGIDGYEVARRIRASHVNREMKLVALTGYGLSSQRQKAFAAGFDMHLVKPVDAEILMAVLDRIGETSATEP
jgi:CheY-like chemotaxis protein